MSVRHLASLLLLSIPTVIVPSPAAAQSVPAPEARTEVLCRATPQCAITLLARLPSAPFPYAADPRQREPQFYNGRDVQTGEPARRIGRYSFGATDHYSDDRVLIHVPPDFDPAHPLRLLVFFHGHLATLRRDVVGRLALPAQVSESGRNVVLIAPQLARDAIDSHPGRLVRQNGLTDLLGRVEAIIARETGATRERIAKAPIILSGFSGGNVAVITTLERGGLRDRIAGVILFDALYGAMPRYAAWFARRDQRTFLVVLYGRSTEKNTDVLKSLFRERGLPLTFRLPERSLGHAENVFLRVPTPHVEIPIQGPPIRPLATILRRLPKFEEFPVVVPGR